MYFFLNHILDFIFPPSPETLELRTLSPKDIFTELPPANPTPHTFITCLFSYKDPLVVELVKHIKNKKDAHAYELAGYALYRSLLVFKTGALLIPIPVSKQRRRERGYNQCELLIDAILKLDTENKFRKHFDLLKRTKHIGDQKLKNRDERLKSSSDLFFSTQNIDTNIPLVIIDDVVTTGSTLKAARETLLRAGYTNVSALTLAH